MKQKKVASDTDRLAFLRQAAIAAQRDMTDGTTYLNEGVIQQAKTVADEFEQAHMDKQAAQEEVWQAQQTRRATVSILRNELTAYWEAARRLVKRQGYPSIAYIFYGLNRNGTNHNVSSQKRVLQQAQETLKQAAKTEAEQYQTVSDPSPNTLQAQLETTMTTFTTVDQAQWLLNEKRTLLKSGRLAADQTIRLILRTLHYQLHSLDTIEKRHIMRRYGVQYEQDYEKVPSGTREENESLTDILSIDPPIGAETVIHASDEQNALSNDAIETAIHQEGSPTESIEQP